MNHADFAARIRRCTVFVSAIIDGFLSYYQRANEGPIGYRGTASGKKLPRSTSVNSLAGSLPSDPLASLGHVNMFG